MTSTDLVRRRSSAVVLAEMPAGLTLGPGEEWWTDNPHRLAARLNHDRSVVEVARYQLTPRRYGAIVTRVKPRPPRWRAPLLLTLLGVTMAGLVVAGLYLLAKALLALAPFILAALGGAWVFQRLLTGHSATCTGLHCPGCRH